MATSTSFLPVAPCGALLNSFLFEGTNLYF